MERIRDITVYANSKETNVFTVDEEEGKMLARAIELMFLTKNADIARTTLSLETGHSSILVLGYVQIAESMFKDPDSVYVGEWQNKKEYFPLQ
jgi:hypothetical protein